MDTKPESSQQNYPDYNPYQMRCPNCGTASPKYAVVYRHPQTGLYESATVIDGCLFSFLAFIAIAVLSDFLIFGILAITGNLSNPLNGDAGLFAYPIAAVGASVALLLYGVRRENRLNKTHIKIDQFTCKHCNDEWDVIQEPPSKEW